MNKIKLLEFYLCGELLLTQDKQGCNVQATKESLAAANDTEADKIMVFERTVGDEEQVEKALAELLAEAGIAG